MLFIVLVMNNTEWKKKDEKIWKNTSLIENYEIPVNNIY